MFGYSIKQISIAIGVGILLIVLGSFIGGSQQTQQPPMSIPAPITTIPSATPSQSPQPAPAPLPALQSQTTAALTVTFVVDGDTVELSTKQRVRLIGIDTPESGSQYYLEAREKMKQFVLNKEVRLEKDISETDRYGRLLRFVYVGNTFVNLEMVRQGYATAYTYPPDIKYADQFVKAEQEARNAKVGLWAIAPTPLPPATIPPPSATAPAPSPTPTPPSSSSTYSLPPCASSDCDCGHFSTHAYAQWFHDNYDPTDKHRLDQDKDGLACESLP